MRFIFLFFALLVVFSSSSFAWTNAKSGIAYQKFILKREAGDVTLHTLKIDPKQRRIRTALSAQLQSIREHVAKSDAIAGINANFFDINGKALGLIVHEGVEVQSLRPISWWGVFCIKSNSARILRGSEYKKSMCDEAVQAGPRLVSGSIVPGLKDELSRKTAVGINAKGEVIFVVSEQSLPIRELAVFMQKPEVLGGLGCTQAMNLDGGSSSQIFIKAGRTKVHIPSYVGIPATLIVD